VKKYLSILLVLLIALGSFGFVSAQDSAPIRVGSKQFTEQLVLGQIILLALDDAGLEVEDRTNLGGTAVNREALINGEIDVYPEYTGTAISNYFTDVPFALESIPEGASSDAYMSYATVSSLDAAINDMVWLQVAPANNTYALAITREFSESNGVTSMDDFAAYVNDGGDVMLSTGDEFAQRPDGLTAFEETYDFDLTDDQMIVIASGTPAQTEQALAEGSNDVNIAMAFGTDGALMAYDFVVLEDPSGAQPVFQPGPVFRGEVVRENPEIAATLNPIFALLDGPTLQGLNAAVEVDGESPEDVARAFLQENGFIE
jgi:osmoprotectant transport system substrate-binding protein